MLGGNTFDIKCLLGKIAFGMKWSKLAIFIHRQLHLRDYTYWYIMKKAYMTCWQFHTEDIFVLEVFNWKAF